MNNRTDKTVKGTITGFLQYGLQVILQALLAPLILRIAGRETLGAYAILMQVIGYGILLDLGFGVALGRYLAQAFGFDDKGRRFIETFNTGRTFYLFINMIFGLLIFVFSLWVNKLLLASDVICNQARLSLYLYGLWIIIRTPLVIYNHALNASQNMSVANFIAILGNAVRLTLSLILVFMKTGLVGLILANILAEALIIYLNFRCFKSRFPHYEFGWVIKDWALFREMFSFGLRYWGVYVAVLLFYGTDNIVVGYLYGAGAASIYYVTKMPIFLFFQVIFKISDNAAPAANELFAKNNFTALQNAYFRLFRYSMLLVMPLAFATIGLNRLLISVWTNSLQYAGDIMTTSIAVFSIIAVVNHVNGTMVLVFGKIRYWSTLSAISGLSGLLLSLFLGKMLGLQGVAVGFTIMVLPVMGFLLYRSMQCFKTNFLQLWIKVYKPAIVSCIPVALLTIIIKLFNPTVSWETLFILTSFYVILWCVGVFKFGINDNEKNTVIPFLKLKFARYF